MGQVWQFPEPQPRPTPPSYGVWGVWRGTGEARKREKSKVGQGVAATLI